MNDLLEMIEPRWRAELERLLEEGEATPEFLAYLEEAPNRDVILDAAVAVQAERIHGLRDAIRTLAQPQADLDQRSEHIAKVASQLREALEATVSAGVRDQMRIFEKAFRDVHVDDVDLLAVTLNGYRQAKRRKSA